jgi:ubiquinone/menaquinone biosynthesis C-methylase UbiE
MKGVEQIDWLYDMILRPMNLLGLGAHRHRLVHDLAGDILEVGVGTGLNLVYYGPAAHVIGIEPDRELLGAARSRAERRGYLLQAADAQALPFAARSFDAVVSTLVFCTIPQPLAALDEIGRVLRPGGRLLQVEHTRTGHARPDALLDWIAPTWERIAGGCHVNRDTAALLERAGWHIQTHERHASGFLRVLISEPPL